MEMENDDVRFLTRIVERTIGKILELSPTQILSGDLAWPAIEYLIRLSVAHLRYL